MKPLSELKKTETIEWLKKQRDGYIVGDYRNILCHVYQEIKSISMNDGYCALQDLVKEDTIYYRTEAQVLELCDMLNTLGYIDIRNHSDGVKLNILMSLIFYQPLDRPSTAHPSGSRRKRLHAQSRCTSRSCNPKLFPFAFLLQFGIAQYRKRQQEKRPTGWLSANCL